jgi:hypothetical protein
VAFTLNKQKKPHKQAHKQTHGKDSESSDTQFFHSFCAFDFSTQQFDSAQEFYRVCSSFSRPWFYVRPLLPDVSVD